MPTEDWVNYEFVQLIHELNNYEQDNYLNE